MKILQINAVNAIGSTGRTSTEMADYLNQHGHEGYIAWSAGPPYPGGYRIGSKKGVKIHGLLSRVFGTQAYFSTGCTKRLLAWMQDLSPDVVHLRNLHGNYINLGLLLNWLADNDVPTVLTLHDCWFYTGKCCHYTVDNCFKWKTGCHACPRLKKDNPSWFFDRSQKMHRDKKEWFSRIPRLAVIGVSDWITNEARQSFLGSAKIVKRIYNWIDLDLFRPVPADDLRRQLGLENKFVILGVSSGWSNSKGLDKFIQLSEMLPEDMMILLVGAMPSGVDLPANIACRGEINEIKRLVSLYSMADVLLNLSLEETFGKVTAEAMACGTPVIAMNSTASGEMVPTGCGILTEAGAELANIRSAIIRLRAKGKLFFSQKCRKFCSENFSMKKCISDYLNLYQDLIAVRSI